THQRSAAVRMLRPSIQKKMPIMTREVTWTLVLQRHSSSSIGGANLLRRRLRRKVEDEALARHPALGLLELGDVHRAHIEAAGAQALRGARESRRSHDRAAR